MSLKFKLCVFITTMMMCSISLAAPPEGKGGGGGGNDGGSDDGGGETALPPVRFRITFPNVPSGFGHIYENDMNNIGQVVGWGADYDGSQYFNHRAVVYSPVSNSIENLADRVDLSLVPSGYTLRSAVAINNHGVVVGHLTNSESERIPFAVDMGLTDPTIDLLPDLGGNSFARHINDDGLILGLSETTPGSGEYISWTYQPGLYNGDSIVRAARDGVPLDLTADLPTPLPAELVGSASLWALNNSKNGLPAQVACVDPDGNAWRYTLGDSAPEMISGLSLDGLSRSLVGMNDSGVLCGTAFKVTSVKKGRERGYYTGYRYGIFADYLPPEGGYPSDMNNSGQVVTTNGEIFADWGDGLGERHLMLQELVVGSDEDLAAWNQLPYVNIAKINDGGMVVGEAWNQVDGVTVREFFVAVPEPAE